MINQELLNKEQVMARISFLEEMIEEKKNLLNMLTETLKRVEGYSNGSKELSDKIGGYIKKQQSELATLGTQQKLQPEIVKFVDTVLGGVRDYVRSTCSEVERIYFARQGELLHVQQEIERLILVKMQLQHKVNSEATHQSTNVESSLSEEKIDKAKKRPRPDKDPSTRAGRAAIDLAERRKKYKKKSET